MSTTTGFECPITKKIMADPVVATDGYTYEREAIEKWFDDGHATVSPQPDGVLNGTTLIPNNHVRSSIVAYLKKNPDMLTLSSDGQAGSVYLPEMWKITLAEAIVNGKIEPIQSGTLTRGLIGLDKRLLVCRLRNGRSAFHLANESPSLDLCALILNLLVENQLVETVAGLTAPAGYRPLHTNALLQKVMAEEMDYQMKLVKADALVKFGADPATVVDPATGNTLLHLAAATGSVDFCRWLLSKGLSATTVRNLKGRTALMEAMLASKVSPERRTEVLSLFVDPTFAKLPLVHMALRLKKENRFAEPATLDALATQYGSSFKSLLEEQDDHHHRTPLEYLVSKSDDLESIEWLLKHGANANTRTPAGETLLHLLVRRLGTYQTGSQDFKRGIQVLKLLIRGGANVNARNNQGKSVAETARELNNPTVLSTIADKGQQSFND